MKKAILFLFAAVLTLTVAVAKDTNPTKKNFTPEPLKAIKDTLQKPAKTPFKFQLGNNFENNYLWRGFVFNKGLICQPDLMIQRGHWSTTLWSNISLKETGGNIVTPEADMFITYKNNYKRFSFAPAVNVFFFPSNYQNIYTMEVAGVFKYNAQPVGFYASPAYDFVSNLGGFYMDYGFFRTDSISSKLSVESKLLMGFGNKKFNEYYSNESGRFPAPKEGQPNFVQDGKSIRLDLQLTYKASNKFTLKPQVTIFRTFSDGNNYSQPPVRITSGVAMVYDF